MDSYSIILWLFLFSAIVMIVALVRRRTILKRSSRFPESGASHGTPGPDIPIPFGYKCAWYLVSTSDQAGIAQLIGLRRKRTANWQAGIEAAYDGEVFISPSVGGWTFIVSTSLAAVETQMLPNNVRRFLERLSSELGTACFFATHRIVELHVWAKASNGRIERGYGYFGETGEVIWDEGNTTTEEINLLSDINEEAVMQVARGWAIAPVDLDEVSVDPSVGILGVL